MSSFDSQSTYQGKDLEDFTVYWWARSPDGRQIHWAMPNGPRSLWEPVPWTYPSYDEEEFDEPDFHAHFQALSAGVAWEYSLNIEEEKLLPEGVVFFTGSQWGLFDPAKEVKPQ